jgi:hypothetical protein
MSTTEEGRGEFDDGGEERMSHLPSKLDAEGMPNPSRLVSRSGRACLLRYCCACWMEFAWRRGSRRRQAHGLQNGQQPVRKVGPWFIKNIKKPDGFCEDRENRTDFIGLPKTGPLELKMFQTAK